MNWYEDKIEEELVVLLDNLDPTNLLPKVLWTKIEWMELDARRREVKRQLEELSNPSGWEEYNTYVMDM